MLVAARISLRNSELITCFAGSLSRERRVELSHWNRWLRPCLEEGSESIVLPRTSSSMCTSIYFERESTKTKCRVSPKLTHKTAEAPGYGKRTVRRIVAEMSALNGAAFSSPAKRYKVDRKIIVLADFDVEALRRVVHEFYSEKKYPTMDSLLSAVKEKAIHGERTTLWKVLRKMGFKYKKVNDKRYIYERPRIIAWRHEYLRRLRRNRVRGEAGSVFR